MGLFLHSNTWRKPLQLIDCWLPEPHTGHKAAPGRTSEPSAVMRRFERAGWLRRSAEPAVARARRVSDGRVALAGRIDEVCRELDRLTELDLAGTRSGAHRNRPAR